METVRKVKNGGPILFVFNEICYSSIQAGVGRLDSVYKETDKQKRQEWRRVVRDELLAQLENKSSNKHIDRVERFIKNTRNEKILKGGRLSVGVAQKILNLFLKYCWSLGWIDKPKDCPIDSRILNKLKCSLIYGPFSKMDRKKYLGVMEKIDKARARKNESRAMWEFNEWENTRNAPREN